MPQITAQQLVADLIDELPTPLPFQETKLRSLYNAGKYGELISVVKRVFHLRMRLRVRLFLNSKAKGCASIKLPLFLEDMPPLNSPAMSHLTIRIDLHRKPPTFEVFVSSICHELSHALLLAVRSKHFTSEKATDATVIVMGFGSIMEKGREHWTVSRDRGRTIMEGEKYGYLSDKEFSVIRKVAACYGR